MGAIGPRSSQILNLRVGERRYTGQRTEEIHFL